MSGVSVGAVAMRPAGTHADRRDGLRADYLRAVVRAVMTETTLPAAVRGACEQLMIIINANDLNKIAEALADLQSAAETHGVLLPHDPQPLRRADGA